MEGTDAEHEGAVDAEQFQHVRPCKRCSLEVVLQGWVSDFLHDEDVLV